MKLRSVFTFIFMFSLFFTVVVKAQHKEETPYRMDNYENLWKEVDRFERQSLPKSAIEQTEKILKQAVKDKNSPQVIKALVVKNKYKQWIDKDLALDIFKDIENLISSTTIVSEKSLLHSMLAELYLNYYESDSYNIGKRTELSGFVPQDIKEWSSAVFYDKVIENLSLSVKERAVLEQVKTRQYDPIITIGETAQTYYPTLYDFLLLRAIELTRNMVTTESLEKDLRAKNSSIKAVSVPVKAFIKLSLDGSQRDYSLMTLEYYRVLLSALSDRNLKESVLLTELSKNDYLQQKSAVYREKYALNTLLALEKEWQQKDITVEIIDNIVNHLENITDQGKYNQKGEDYTNKTEIYNWLQKGIKRYPDYKRINILKNRLNYLEQPSAVITGQKTYYPSKEKFFDLQYKNLNQLTLKIYKVEPALSTADYQRNNDLEKKELVKTVQVDLLPKTTYIDEKTSFVVDINTVGYYKIEIISDKSKNIDNTKAFYFSISEIAVFNRINSKNETEFYIADRFTGIPIKGATVEIYNYNHKNSKYTLVGDIQTGTDGFAFYKKENQNNDYMAYRVVYKNNPSGILNHLPNNYRFSTENEAVVTVENISIFTDRDIYRPGQTVYFKAVAANKLVNKDYTLIPFKEHKVTLYDVNRQLVSEQKIKTNEFGSLAGEFILPQGSLNGNYSIEINHNSEYFKVEEYKRPTFEIIFDKINTSYKFGEKVVLKGKAQNFSGIKLQNAGVDYTITKSQLLWRWGGNSTFYKAGNTVTQEDGTFEITFMPEQDQGSTKFPGVYTFKISATVTDSNGATQTEVHNINVGNVSMLLNVSVPERLEKMTDQEMVVKASNLDGQEIDTEGIYTIYTLTEKDSVDTKVFSSKFKSGEGIQFREIVRNLISGKYCIKVETKDSNGILVEAKQHFVLYSDKDKYPPIKTNEWFIPKSTSFGNDKKGEVVLGVSDQEVHVLYEIVKGDKIFERKQLVLSNENKTFTLPYKTEYGEGVYMSFTYIKDEKVYHPGIEIKKEIPNKSLALKFSVFRDKLRPGQQEEWCISVQDSKAKPVYAELLASMYDVSLDKIYKSKNWRLDLSDYVGITPPIILSSDNSFARIYEYLYLDSTNLEVIPLSFDQLNWHEFSFYNNHYFSRSLKGKGRMSPVASAMALKTGTKSKVSKMETDMTMDTAIAQEALNETTFTAETTENMAPVIRRNFNETAFFYPQLRTNEKGEITIAFTVPESNTTWKFKALAYDKALNTGSLEAQVISRKELMVTPNIPRFLRQGDQTCIETKISNLSDKALSGKVSIEFFDPVDESIVKSVVINNQTQSFQVEKENSTSVNWTFTVPEDMDLLGCRIIAENEFFSDGEQHLLTVLPNRMLVTESMPIHVNGNETKEFRMEQLIAKKSKSLSNYRLTLEFNSNPAWYAIQALPFLSNPDNEDVVNLFASYYVNTLAAAISKSYPKVNRMIEAWIKQGETKETFYSKLQKNEELKNVLLEETPWVLDAKEETAQMQRLSLLFDINRSKQQTNAAIAKIQALQNPDGGWSWYKGMKSNRNIIQYILYGFSQLIHLKAVEYPESVKMMQINALQYMDQQLMEDYNNLKKYNKNWQKIESISTNQLEFLYVRSNYRDIPISQETREAERFYTAVAEKNWTKFNLYERAVLTLLAKKNGNEMLATSIVKSLREHATTNEVLGMFWANNSSQAFMSQSAVTAHTFIMEAFGTLQTDVVEMDRMKLWLLKQKQTQKWESTPATIDAIYTLLSTGTNWLSNEGQAKITVNNKVVKPQNTVLGTGYIKQVWNTSEIIPNMGIVKVEQQDNKPAWGALYWQYFENMDKVSGQKGNLNVEKKFFVETTTTKGVVLVPVTKESILKIGDKVVVRLTTRTDRDMKFVQLKDMRASCFEPIEAISTNKWQNGVLYYQTTKDASTNFYFDLLPKGTYVFEYPVYVTHSGVYSNGITTIQCLYAPEFIGHTAGMRIEVKK